MTCDSDTNILSSPTRLYSTVVYLSFINPMFNIIYCTFIIPIYLLVCYFVPLCVSFFRICFIYGFTIFVNSHPKYPQTLK